MKKLVLGASVLLAVAVAVVLSTSSPSAYLDGSPQGVEYDAVEDFEQWTRAVSEGNRVEFRHRDEEFQREKLTESPAHSEIQSLGKLSHDAAYRFSTRILDSRIERLSQELWSLIDNLDSESGLETLVEEADLRRRLTRAESQRRSFLEGNYWILHDEDVSSLPELEGVSYRIVGWPWQGEGAAIVIPLRVEDEPEVLSASEDLEMYKRILAEDRAYYLNGLPSPRRNELLTQLVAILEKGEAERTEEEKELLQTHLVPGVLIDRVTLKVYTSEGR